ncbi:RagB/SusD family nutrient uptake outer membrane protein [Bacteroides sp. 519]|uniref:RagB/SusD family nutrient uptake outer membrane protein n=1 Tax=Bacteroides sp. 519 TaxID=2302937 RepID=UPI0013D54B8A|nr:RagB/SusD family nutrient uptake outer membrane protein [Bacteroides sp. 519]NDV59058.1 RagB/SusD family nutrient uptake outer membrane protein [Bacteroides sp. 519]
MKKIYTIIAAMLITTSLFTACNDDFMQQDPIDDMANGTFFTKEGDLSLYLDGLYQYYLIGHGRGETNVTTAIKTYMGLRGGGSPIVYGDMLSDNAVYTTANSATTDPDGKLSGTYETPNTAPAWYDAPWEWKRLRKVNYFLNHYQEVSTTNPENLKKWAAEAYFFKAMDYYTKLLSLGEVPWLTKELTLDAPELYSSRTPRVELVDSIMMCLNFAVDNLLDNNEPAGRVNQDQALFLKAKFCLFEGTFRKYHTELNLQSTATKFLEESAEAAKRIMDKGRYQLYKDPNVTDSYWQLFSQTDHPSTHGNKETILARVYDGATVGTSVARYWGFNNHTRYACGAPLGVLEEYLCEDGKPIYLSGTPGNYVQNPLFKGYDGLWEELDNRDPRLTQTICKPGQYASVFDYNAGGKYGIDEVGIIYPAITQATGGGSPTKMYNTTVTGYRFIKHFLPNKAIWDDNPKGKQTAHIFRYGELLLIYAEAKAELGTISNDDLDKTINALRARAGFNFTKYPDSKLSLSNIPADPRLDAIYTAKLDYSVTPIIREVRRERRVEMMMEGQRYEDLIRWKAGKLFTVPLRGMKMTAVKEALYDGRIDQVNPKTGIKETAAPKYQKNVSTFVDSEGFIIPWAKSTRVIDGVLPWDDRRYYFPIPLKELQLNPNLTQNPGWKDINR